MICKCKEPMQSLVCDYNGYEDKIGEYLYCYYCGRIFYKDLEIKKEDGSHWIEPTYLEKKKVKNSQSCATCLKNPCGWNYAYHKGQDLNFVGTKCKEYKTKENTNDEKQDYT